MKTSVAICTYNGEKYLREQLDSILNQTVSVDEIVICDDNSSDGTHDIIEQYCSKYPNIIKFYINEINLRSVKNFEKAISLCNYEIIFLSDQDDIWVNEKVEEYLEFFEKNKNIKVLASNGYCLNDNSQIEEKYAIWDVPNFLNENKVSYNYFDLINYVANIATGASMAFRKIIVPDIVPFPIINGFYHDEWISIISSYNNEFKFLEKKYFYYRIHSDQQVGGVFFDKNYKNKLYLTEFFNIQNENIPFYMFKKRLSKIVSLNRLSKKLLETHPKYNLIFEGLIIKTNLSYYTTKRKMQINYPVNSFFMNISDKLLLKRRF